MRISALLITIAALTASCSNEKPPITPHIDIVKLGKIGWTDKVKCFIEYDDGTKSDKLPAEIKFRGGISAKYYKHSFSLEMDEKIKLGGLPADDDWILNANYIDKTFMRHKISYDLFNEMSPRNFAPICSYVNVSINQAYQGLYVLMQEVNAGMLQLDKKDTNAILYKDPPIFYKNKTFPTIDSTNYFNQKFPKFSKRNKSAEIIKFRDLLFYKDDSTFAADISSMVDIRNVIDWHIILLFSNNGDGIVKNFYLFKRSANAPFEFAIWDYDHTYGREGDYLPNDGKDDLPWANCLLLERLVAIERTGYKKQLKERWIELRNNGVLTLENFESLIAENDKKIRHEIENNYVKWPKDGLWYLDDNSYQAELDIMRAYLKNKLPKLDKYVSHL